MSLNIKSFLSVLFAGFFLSTATVFAQDPRFEQDVKEKIEKSRRDRAALEAAANASDSAKALAQKFAVASSENQIKQIIDDVVQNGDKSVIPYLKSLLAGGFTGSSSLIEVALFQMGEEEYLNKAMKEISSDTAQIRYIAIWKLAQFKDKRAYRKLYELLDDETIREKNTANDYLVPTMSGMVKEELARTVDDPPKGADRFSTEAWKKWFEDHPSLLD